MIEFEGHLKLTHFRSLRMKPRLFLLFPIICCIISAIPSISAQATSISGVVLDKSAPIPYSTVENISKKTGVVTDEQGKFTIEAEQKDTILIKSLGFKNQLIVGFKKENLRVILEPEVYDLSTVNIAPREPIFLTKEHLIKRLDGGYGVSTGTVTAFFIAPDEKINKPSFLTGASIFIDNEGVINTPIRVRCMSNSNAARPYPGKDLYRDEIIIRPKRANSWQKIDLRQLNLTIPEEGMFVCFEYFEDKPQYYYQDKVIENGKRKTYRRYGSQLGAYWSAEPNLTWIKNLGDLWFQRETKIGGKTMHLAIKYIIMYDKKPD
jgi:CarboxypepD_reg-like domain